LPPLKTQSQRGEFSSASHNRGIRPPSKSPAIQTGVRMIRASRRP
jgi:hypothetical protein